VNTINRIDIRLLIFCLLFLNTFSLILDENEEQYLAFAKAFINHDWIPGAVSLKDVPGTRIIFDSVTGWLLNFATFEQVAVFGRALIALLFAFPLARIFKRFQFTNLAIIFALQIICVLSHQSFFAKEWIFGSFESKAVSYVFIFYSLSYLFDNRNLLSVLFSGLAVYFHILAGGWYSLILFIYLLISKTPLKTILLYGLTFAFWTAPIGIYLAATYLINNPAVIGGVQISQVYVFIRNPHHLDIIKQIGQLGSSAQTGIILSLLCCALCFRLLDTGKDQLLRKVALLNIIIFCQQFLSLFIAVFDKTGAFLKYYPYRTSSLSFFLMFIILGILLRERFSRQGCGADLQPPVNKFFCIHSNAVAWLIILCIFAGLGIKLYKNIGDSSELLFPSSETSDRFSLYDWIKINTQPDAVFLDLNKNIRDDLDFIRRTERDSYSVFKFVPTTNRLIYDWYMRVLEKKKVQQNIAYVHELRQKYRIDYMVSKIPLSDNGLQLVFNNNYYFLYSFYFGQRSWK
jgi:hypothetical protein